MNIFDGAISLRLMLLGVIVVWVALGAPAPDSEFSVALLMGVIFYVLAARINYQIGSSLSDFVVCIAGGLAALAVLSLLESGAVLQKLTLAACGTIGYGAAGFVITLVRRKQSTLSTENKDRNNERND